MEIKDSIVLVTGAGRGWGRSISIAFAREGARVIIVSRTESELEQTARIIRDSGGSVDMLAADLGSSEGIDNTFDLIQKKYKKLDVLINAAAIMKFKEFNDTSEDEIQLLTNVNLLSYLMMCKKFLSGMIDRKQGCIINISSNAGIWAFEKECVYAATKFAIEGFSKSLSLEVRRHNISVNTITPGGIDAGVKMKPTSMLDSEFESLDASDKNKYTDSLMYTEAFIYLAKQSGTRITGERVLAYELSQSIREKGWNTPYVKLDQVRPEWM